MLILYNEFSTIHTVYIFLIFHAVEATEPTVVDASAATGVDAGLCYQQNKKIIDTWQENMRFAEALFRVICTVLYCYNNNYTVRA